MIAYTDGATFGRTRPGVPSPIGAGVVIYNEHKHTTIDHTICEALGLGSSNDAEWLALILAVEYFLTETDDPYLKVRSDSQLIVNQAKKNWVINKKNLQKHARRFFFLKKIAKKLGRTIEIEWIRREENKDADKVSKAAASLAADTVGLGPPDA